MKPIESNTVRTLLSPIEKNKIVVGSITNKGIVSGITTFRHWVIEGEVVGRWRGVYESGGVYYFV
jgi:hypothetical protein